MLTLLQTTLNAVCQDTIKTDTTVLNKVNVANYLTHTGVKYKDIVYAQILIESNSFRSRLCKSRHNLLGMHCVSGRPSTAIGHTKGYARYDNWMRSIDDYVYFQQKLLSKRDMTRTEYLHYLRHNYAASKNYDRTINRVAMSDNVQTIFKNACE